MPAEEEEGLLTDIGVGCGEEEGEEETSIVSFVLLLPLLPPPVTVLTIEVVRLLTPLITAELAALMEARISCRVSERPVLGLTEVEVVVVEELLLVGYSCACF